VRVAVFALGPSGKRIAAAAGSVRRTPADDELM
jgi:hypothetical protein